MKTTHFTDRFGSPSSWRASARTHLGLIAATALLLSLVGCADASQFGYGQLGDGQDSEAPTGFSGGDEAQGDNDAPFAGPENYAWDEVADPELAEDVVNLDEEPCFDSIDVNDDFTSATIHLVCPATAVEVEAGDLIVSSYGSGYLLRVLSSEDGDYTILAETTPGTLTELFPNGGFSATFPLEDLSRAPLVWGANDIVNENGLRIRFEGATVDLNTPELFFGTSHTGGIVSRRDMYLQMDSSISLAVSASATAAITKSKSVPLATYTFPIRVVTPAFIYVGTVELTAKLKVSAEIKAAAQLRVGATLDTTLRVGTTYNEITDRFEDLENIEATFTADDVIASTSKGMSLKASIDLRANLKHYSVLSTYVEMGPYLKLAGTPECSTLDWALTSGWGGKAGAHLDIWRWTINILSVPWNQPFGGPLAEGSIDLPVSVGGEDCDPEPDPDPDSDPEPESTAEGTGSCSPVQELVCGQTVTGDTSSDPDATTALDGYTINVGNYDAPELVYRWNGSGPVRFRFVSPRPTQVNHDIMIIEATEETESCSDGESFDYGFNSVLWDGSGSVFVVVDGYDSDSGAFELEVDCNP
jgi:hypothetical protein